MPRLPSAAGVLTQALAERLPDWSWEMPRGRPVAVGRACPTPTRSQFSRLAARYGVIVRPGPLASPDGGFRDHIRIAYGTDPARIVEGVDRLAAAWAEYTPSRRYHATVAGGQRLRGPRLIERAPRTIAQARSPGSSVRPVWTGEGWMIVLAGDTSQWKRFAIGNRAIGPPGSVAAGDPLDGLEVKAERSPGRHRARSPAGAIRPSAGHGTDEGLRAAEQHDARVDALAAFDVGHDAG